MTKKDEPNELVWTEAKNRPFKSLKKYISKPPILKLPNFEQEFVLQTDASNNRIGAILLQEELAIEHPIAFASRKLLPREIHYSTIEKECLAIVWAIQKFQNFLYGKSFIPEMDHEPFLLCHRRCSRASPGLTAIGLVNGNPSFSTNHRIDVP